MVVPAWCQSTCLMNASSSRVPKFGPTGAVMGELGMPIAKHSLRVKKAIYRCLGSHANILKYDGQVLIREGLYSVKLERALGNLRQLILECPMPTEQTRLKMAIQISCAMSYLHSKNIFYNDFSCRNIFVLEGWLLKIGDFGGSKIDDEEPLIGEETRYQLPLRGREWEDMDDTKREIFALGCGIYGIIALKAPFLDLTEEEVLERYNNIYNIN
jgi:serine/threonine protein kinase